jgi:Zn-dependent peptidase ImmA (M78 family)
MVTTFVMILVGMNIGAPVRCYPNVEEWKAEKANVLTHPSAVAFYNPNPAVPYIALGPRVCKNVMNATFDGAFVLAHEIGHLHQDLNDTPYDEIEADHYAELTVGNLWERLQRYFKKPKNTLFIKLAG